MIRIYNITESEQWDEIVCSFSNYDVYYLSGYVKAFQLHGDGVPQLLYYVQDGLRAIYVYMRRTTTVTDVYDSITPYNYGGFLLEGNVTEKTCSTLWKAYVDEMKTMHIVDSFVRYHPVLENAVPMKLCSEVIDLGKTVAMDLTSADVIWTNIHTKNRNMIRKAEKNGVIIKQGQGMDLMDEFIKIYNATMEIEHAEKYYYFKREFYECIDKDLRNNYKMFYAEYDGKIIAMSIMLFANGRLNYHLSGSDLEYRNLAPSNLLLYKAALWGCEQGLKSFHLGGGVGCREDNLYKFKFSFNRFSDYQFSIAKHIFNREKYDELVAVRASQDSHFNCKSMFFPLYRS